MGRRPRDAGSPWRWDPCAGKSPRTHRIWYRRDGKTPKAQLRVPPPFPSRARFRKSDVSGGGANAVRTPNAAGQAIWVVARSWGRVA
jgi:hypothetical protein